MSDEPWAELEDETTEGGPRRVVRLKCGKIRFNTGSAVFPYRGIEVIKGVLLYLDQLGDEKVKVLIAAHTDTVDDHENNQVLSDQRARSTLHMLEFNRDAWATLCHEESQGSKALDVKQVLKWASKAYEWPCSGKGQAADVQAFKESYLAYHSKTTLTDTTPTVDVDFWKRVFNLYQWTLYAFLRSVKAQPRKEFLKNLEWLDPQHKAIGCSERDLLVPTANNRNNPENRRVEFLFFKPGLAPSPDDPDLPETDTRQPQGSERAPLPPLWLESVYDPQRYTFFDLDCPRPTWMGRPLPEGNILFVIDRSGSMKAKSKWKKLKQALIGAINGLTEDDNFGILAFSSDLTVLWGTTAAPKLKVATEANRDAAIDWVNGTEPTGGTFTYQAVASAFAATGLRTISKERGEFNTVEFLSDGQPTTRKRKCDSCAEITACVAWTDNKTCPSCSTTNKSFLAGWAAKDETDALLAEIKANNTDGWVVNATAFVDKNKDATKDPLRKFMEDIPKQSDPNGTFAAIKF